jgi:hypothetical protein
MGRDIEQMGVALDKLYQDVYVGDGKQNPPITTRLYNVEEVTDSIRSNLTKLVWLMVVTLFTVAGDLILRGFK